jgi:uncharacterized membrane protein YhhN
MWILLCAVFVFGLVVAEHRQDRTVMAVTKLAAASCFLGEAWAASGLESAYGRLILLGLGLCWIGDALLLRPGRTRVFQLGIGAFLMGHVAYGVAFVSLGFSPAALAVTALVLLPMMLAVARWLIPHVPGDFRVPVVAYLLVISAMVCLAVAAAFRGGPPAAAAGAIAFAVSDLFVARDRFVTQGPANARFGLPLYFGSQLAIAATAGAG